MVVNNQKIRELKDNLSKKDTAILLQTLKEVKMEGNYSLIPYLVYVLKNTSNPDIENEIIGILNNINLQSSVPYLVDSIKDTEDKKILNILISSCWKNGLDFSDYLEVFVDQFLHYDFDISLEAFTVIENATTKSGVKENDRMIVYLNNNYDNVSKEKKLLIRELVQIFERRNHI